MSGSLYMPRSSAVGNGAQNDKRPYRKPPRPPSGSSRPPPSRSSWRRRQRPEQSATIAAWTHAESSVDEVGSLESGAAGRAMARAASTPAGALRKARAHRRAELGCSGFSRGDAFRWTAASDAGVVRPRYRSRRRLAIAAIGSRPCASCVDPPSLGGCYPSRRRSAIVFGEPDSSSNTRSPRSGARRRPTRKRRQRKHESNFEALIQYLHATRSRWLACHTAAPVPVSSAVAIYRVRR